MDPLSLDNDSVDSYCNQSLNYDELRPILIVFSSTSFINAVMILIAIGVMAYCQLYKLVTHRLIINMLVSIIFFCIVVAAQLMGLWRHYWNGQNYGECVAGGFFMEYSLWVMLSCTFMMTLHLTSMVIFYKKVAILQPFYLLFPWIFPLLIAWIPFINNNYGVAGPWCWIRLYNEDCSQNTEGVIEMYALWYGELIFGLILNNIGLLVIAITLCKRSCSTNEMSSGYRKTLKQTLPLVIYLIAYQVISIFAIANKMYQVTHHGRYMKWLIHAQVIVDPFWGLLAPILTYIYIIIEIRGSKKHKCCFRNKHRYLTVNYNDSEDHLSQYGSDIVTSPTGYHIPTESECDQEYGERIVNQQ